MLESGIIILDYGSQYTLLIARRFRELGFYSEVIDGRAAKAPTTLTIKGIVLSGGPDSVYEDGSRALPEWVLKSGLPVLGICYGLQLLAKAHGGNVRAATAREYGAATIELTGRTVKAPGAEIFSGLAREETVWMSHGDDVTHMGAEFVTLAQTTDRVLAAVCHKTLPIIGIQFHPEVNHSTHGAEMLSNFCERICKLTPTWRPAQILEKLSADIRTQVGKTGHVLMAVSGGVDSSVAAALLAHALGGERVTAVFVDQGLLRKDEGTKVMAALKAIGVRHIEMIPAQDMFLERLAGVSDPEEKRKIIGRAFIEVFEAFAKKSSAKGGVDHPTFTHLGQGTLYPDVIESAGHGAGSKVIKSHHNVGGLPEKLALPLVEPLRFLFKDEVRALGVELGLPAPLVYRHPFPGPGLAIRMLGAVDKEGLDLLRDADDIFIRALREAKLYDTVWQAFCVLLPIRTVGVMGDNRTYERTLALRSVAASDGMTAGVGMLPMEFLTKVAGDIIRQVPGINRVVYDITSKPPATIEWE